MTLLIITAYTCTTLLAYDRVKARFPDWQMRAELLAMVAGITVLFLLTLLTYRHYPHVPYTPAPPPTA